MATITASMDVSARKLNHQSNHFASCSSAPSPATPPPPAAEAAVLAGTRSTRASSFAAAAAAGAGIAIASPAAGGVYVASNMVGRISESGSAQPATLTVQPGWRPDFPGAAFQPAQAARLSHVYQSTLYAPLTHSASARAEQQQQQQQRALQGGGKLGGMAGTGHNFSGSLGNGAAVNGGTSPASIGAVTPVTPPTPLTPAPSAAHVLLLRSSSMNIISPMASSSRKVYNAGAAGAVGADAIPGFHSMVSPSSTATSTFSPKPSFTPTFQPATSYNEGSNSLPPRSPANAHAAAAPAAPAVAAAALLYPDATWSNLSPFTTNPLSPRASSKIVDQIDYELQQLTYWWSIVDQVVEELHGEGMHLQEKLEELGQRQQTLENLLHGLGSLGVVDRTKGNMTAAR